MQIVPPCPQGLGNTRAQLIDATCHFLKPGARSRDQADRTAPDDVGKAERKPIDDGGAAIRPHHHQLPFLSQRLDGPFVLKADVVAEQHHIHAQA